MSIASEITRIQGAKANLKTAIEGKGVTVPSSTKLDGYADLVDDIQTGGEPNLQDKAVSYTPTESTQTATVTADSGYDGLDEVSITVGAIASDYVGSAVIRRNHTDISFSGDYVDVPYGYYEDSSVAQIPHGTEGTPTASKGAVSNHSVSVTPSVINTAGYIEGGTKTGAAVSVSASELVSGTKPITQNGTEDVTNYASVSVAVPNSYSASDEGKVVSNGALVSQSSATYTTNDTYDTTLIDEVTVNVSGGDNYKVLLDNFSIPSSYKWNTPPMENGLSNGEEIEAIVSDPLPANGTYLVLSVADIANISNWKSAYSMHLYHIYDSDNSVDNIAIRNNNTGITVPIDSSNPIHIKIDKDYLYVNGTQAIAMPRTILNRPTLCVGATEGQLRCAGEYQQITWK